jgi:hypothetical protein
MISSIISISLGIIAAIILFYLSVGTEKIIYHGPNSKDVKKKVFTDELTGKCYMFKPQIYLCPN